MQVLGHGDTPSSSLTLQDRTGGLGLLRRFFPLGTHGQERTSAGPCLRSGCPGRQLIPLRRLQAVVTPQELFPCSAVNSNLISRLKMCLIFSLSHLISSLSARRGCTPLWYLCQA